jgi:hypothetical protein
MMPQEFETPPLSEEPGTTGRMVRVVVGITTFFFASYYQTMQLQSLLVASRPERTEYTIDMLTRDVEQGRVRLLFESSRDTIETEMRNSQDAALMRLSKALITHPPKYVSNEIVYGMSTYMNKVFEDE